MGSIIKRYRWLLWRDFFIIKLLTNLICNNYDSTNDNNIKSLRYSILIDLNFPTNIIIYNYIYIMEEIVLKPSWIEVERWIEWRDILQKPFISYRPHLSYPLVLLATLRIHNPLFLAPRVILPSVRIHRKARCFTEYAVVVYSPKGWRWGPEVSERPIKSEAYTYCLLNYSAGLIKRRYIFIYRSAAGVTLKYFWSNVENKINNYSPRGQNNGR